MTSKQITITDLKKIAPDARLSIIRDITQASWILDEYGITDNDLRLSHFMAQAALETDGFRTLREYGSTAYFRRRYGHRKDLGNRSLADGARFRGRGIFQLTGRYNYRRYGKLVNVDLENQPHLAARADISVRIACVYWNSKKLSLHADADDIRKITKRINGGYNGLKGRKRYLKRARKIWPGAQEDKQTCSCSSSHDSKNSLFSMDFLKQGMRGVAVRQLQMALLRSGFSVLADGIFGWKTRKKLVAFQKKFRLDADGVVGNATRSVLTRYLDGTLVPDSFKPAIQPPRTKRIFPMTNWKSYLESRTIWANAIGLVALVLSAFGLPSIGAEDQAALIDGILKLVEATGFIGGAFFRYIANKKLAV